MAVNIVVPELGESVVEATVGKWHKAAGEPVDVGEVVVELETDKVDLEVGAAGKGVLARIERAEGENVRIGDVLGIIDEMPASHAESIEPAREIPPEPPPQVTPREAAPAQASPESVRERVGAPRATPSARRLALEKDVDLRKVGAAITGTPITPSDVVAYSERRDVGTETPRGPAAALQPSPEGERREERVRMSRRRLTIATRLVDALRAAAMVTTFNDVDMGAVMDLRRRNKDSFRQRYGVGLGIISFFVKASVSALRAFPRLNAEIQGTDMVLKHYYDIGIAVGAPEGLVVPVIRDAERLSFGALEQAIKAFARKAEEGTLTLEDLRGGTFTISNGGVFGSLLSTPILNPPQVGILGLHRIEERPVNVAGEVRIRPMMYLALSYDHRIVDGLEAVQFLGKIKEMVENPEDLLLQM